MSKVFLKWAQVQNLECPAEAEIATHQVSSLEMAHSGRLAEVGSLETNRGERKLGRENPVDRKLSKNVQNGPRNPDMVGKMENKGSSSVAGEISELLGNSPGLSLSGEGEAVESEGEMGGNLFGEQSPPRLVVPSEKPSYEEEKEEMDFLAQHHSQFMALLEAATNMGNFSKSEWELFMAYKVADINVEQMEKKSVNI